MRQQVRLKADTTYVVSGFSRTLGSEALAQLFLQLVPVAATERKPLPITQDDDVFAVEPGLQLFDALSVDDPRTVDADEPLGIETRLHAVHRLAEEMRFLAEV